MILTYLCPALMDWLIFFAAFAVFYRAGEFRLPTGQTVGLAVWLQVAYMVTCPLAGRVLNRKTAKPLVIAATIGCTLTGVLALVADTFHFMLVVLSTMGIHAALFFNAFQTYMRSEAPPGGLTPSVAFYTLAWSAGAAGGQLLSGMLYTLGPRVLVPANLLVGVVVLVLLLRKTSPETRPSAEEHIEEGSPGARPVNPAYVLVGWIMIFTAMFVQRPILTFVPATSSAGGITPAAAGWLLFLHMLVQALFGFAMMYGRDWLYRRTPFLLIQGGGTVVLGILACVRSYGMLMVGLSLLGVYAGFVYFSAVYYAGNTGQRSRNVGINELLVGLGSVAGLLACEVWWRWFHDPRGIYGVAALVLALSTGGQVLVVSSNRAMPSGMSGRDL